MAISVLERPQGVFLGDCFAATIDEDYSTKATVNTTTPHGLADGNYVYVTSNIEDYNGFWVVDVIDGFHFFILPYSGGAPVTFIVNADITYCIQNGLHEWSCVHLPITYKLKSNRFPINTIDVAQTVVSFTNEAGYVQVTLSGSLGLGAEELEFLQISGATDEDVNGVFQIINKVSPTVITINLAYSASYSFSGASVILYYNNYAISVRIYAGITPTHHWSAQKPYELAATKQFVPDADGTIKFSISDVLRGYINVRNNPLLATLPNNIDFWCNFYISYAESYDQSNGYTITTQEDSFTDDSSNFEGYAANAELPFKNQYSGFLTGYVSNQNNGCRWLTKFIDPILFTGNYFDLSVILDQSQALRLLRNGVVIFTSTVVNRGLYRFPITQGGTYKVQVLGSDFTDSITVTENEECSQQEYYLSWLNHLGGFDYWKFTAVADHIQEIKETGETTNNLLTEWPKSGGEFADTRRKQTFRTSAQQLVIRSQYLTLDQLTAIEEIRKSVLVQIVTSRSDRRTVIVDQDSFTSYADDDKLHTIQFTISYTNNNPSQRT